LTHQKLSAAMQHQARLLLLGLRWHEPHEGRVIEHGADQRQVRPEKVRLGTPKCYSRDIRSGL
jgi:hypothetical protein